MNSSLGSLARFAQVDSVRQVGSLVIDEAWADVHGSSPVVVQYDGVNSDVIRFSPEVDTTRTERARAALLLTEQEFLSVLVWLVRQGLLEHVGLVSTETAPPVPVETHSCLCTLEPARVGARHASPVQDDNEIEMDWPRYFRERELTETSPVQEEEGEDAENEGEPNAPFALPIVELVEGDGDPEWLTEPHVMIYLHHELELSATDISRLCDTTPARVRGALKRLGIECKSYMGGRSKLAPRSESGYTVP